MANPHFGTIVTYTQRRKRTRKPAKARQPIPAAIVSAKKPGKAKRQPEPDDGQAFESVQAFFKRTVRPRCAASQATRSQ